MKRNVVIRILAVVLALAMPLTTASVASFFVSAQSNTEKSTTPTSADMFSADTLYASPDINDLTGLGQEPEDLSVSAGATYREKAWYEYVTYSDKAVASYRLDDDYRLLFYDPYTYTNAMVMDVQFDATTTEFDTMSSYTISKTNKKSMSACVESTDTSTEAVQSSGRDETHTEVQNGGQTKTEYNHKEDTSTSGSVKQYTDYEYERVDYITESSTIAETLASETTFEISLDGGVSETVVVGTTGEVTWSENSEWLTKKSTDTTEYSPDYKTSISYSGEATVQDNTNSVTDGWTQLSARVTKTLGSSRSTSNSWSEEESVTVTKVYEATHFAADGVTPLPWAIVHYEVQMPMKCTLQVKHSGEWVTVSTIYTMLSTVKGTCRAWMENGQVYYEDWGSGEPVVATDFWAQFMTKEQLMNAYTNKLYPVGGED